MVEKIVFQGMLAATDWTAEFFHASMLRQMTTQIVRVREQL